MVSCSGWNAHGSLELTPPSNSHGDRARLSVPAPRDAAATPGPLLQADAEDLLAGDPVQRHQREGEGERSQRHAEQLEHASGVALGRASCAPARPISDEADVDQHREPATTSAVRTRARAARRRASTADAGRSSCGSSSISGSTSPWARSPSRITGGVVKLWCGAGDGTVHSRPVRAFPDARRRPWRRCAASSSRIDEHQERRGEQAERADRGDHVPVGEHRVVVRDAARHAGEAEEVLREEQHVDEDRREPEVQLARASRCTCGRSTSAASSRRRP